jgi:ABC-type branched-subunit amino acid transport system substrate-binding protein
VLGLAIASRTPDPVRAQALRSESEGARRRFGIATAESASSSSGSTTRAVGVVLPLSGKSKPLGERALRGILVGANVLPPLGQPIDVRVRDSGSKPEQAAAAVEELAREGAVAIIGSPDRVEAAAVAARASALGLPLVDLAPEAASSASGESATFSAFHVLRPNTARAEALAAAARDVGARRFATLAPDTPYGRRMADAFSAAARARGGEVVAELRYPEKSTTFIAPAKQLAKAKVDAVFVPATASQLELVAAQLAAAGVTRAERDAAGKPERKNVTTLYATADGLGPRFLANAGRYTQGAVLAPVYQGPQGEPGSPVEAAIQRFRTACGEDPGAADAIAFDAVVALRDVISRLPSDTGEPRRAVAAALGTVSTEGLTGPVRFGAGGERAGRPPLYVVDGPGVRPIP